jgi:CHAT domain-containing protein
MSLASEESFKSFSGKVINVIHIATHGFYYTSDEANSINYDFLMLNNNMASVEDKSLTRSGLLMAGANHILEGENLPDNVEDGILTAKEISDVDLRGLDLVVLSACQTGLGDISQSEGVFGLQRGFKKAGANAILMSLWEVDDKATQILMTQFYKNLLSGQSKRHSLQAAQKYLREYNNGFFNEPKYWAAFILLDGIK